MRRRLATLLAIGALLTGTLFTAGIVIAANQGANLDQCANDPQPSLPTNGCSGATGENGWVNGNLGASKSIYREGDSIAYRMRFTNLAGGASFVHSVIIEWDTTKGGKHAIDYLTTWNRTVANADPKLGVVPNPGAANLAAIPVDPQVQKGLNGAIGGGDDINPGPDGTTGTADDATNCIPPVSPGLPCTGYFTLFGGSITQVSGITYFDGAGFAGDKSARVTVSFTSSVLNPVLAWGGHIATRGNWPGFSAINIPGSPYHMRLIDLDGAGGNQDRSLSADAVIFPGSITIIKDVAGGQDAQDFSFTETASTTIAPSSFILDDDANITRSNTQSYTNILNFIGYTFDEAAVDNWVLSFNTPACTVLSANGGTQPTSATGVTINLKEGENVTCTFVNTHLSNSPSLGTTPNPASGAIGATLNDSADLTGETAGATGNITFYLFAPGDDCSSNLTAVYTEIVASSGGAAATDGDGTGSRTATVAGTYHWKAVYAGDANNNGATSPCASEPVIISPNSPSLGTTPNPASGAIGATLNDSADLTGETAGATGNITFYLFAPGDDCSSNLTAVYTEIVASSGGAAATDGDGTGSRTATVAGTYHWKAVYAGDANNNGATSPCASEPVIISPNSPSLGTTPNPASGAIGATLNDSADLTGETAGATGNITFYLFAPGDDCSSNLTAVYTEIVASSGGAAATDGDGTGSRTATVAGTYHWKAVYAGDANNNGATSPCASEPVIISPNSPSLGTTPNPASGAIGATLNDSADLTGETAGATGNITFYLFAPGDDCSSNLTAVYTEIVASSGGAAATDGDGTGSRTATVAGTYHWKAVYAGDANNNGATSPCASEPVIISPNSPSLGTTPNPASGAIGATLNDSADLTGETAGATGNITFYLFAPGDDCSSNLTAVYTEIVASSGGAAATDGDGTGSRTATVAGTYHWKAVYAGDANNNGATSPCASEPVIISPNSPSLGTTPNPASGAIGATLNDSADLTGETAGATGNITFYLFAPGDDCSSNLTAVYTEIVASSGGAAATDGDGTGSRTATVAGTYHWKAVYAGDANNNGATSPCASEPVIIDKNEPSVQTTPNLLPNDSVTISNLADPGAGGYGNLIVELRQGADCAGELKYSRTFTPTDLANQFTGNGTYDTNNTTIFVTDDAELHWCTTYTGDANNDDFGPDDTNEIIKIEFNPEALGAFGLGLFLLGFMLRRKVDRAA